jgi:hypothetical protein
MTTINRPQALPTSPFTEDTDPVGIVITSGVSSYFRITGTELNRVVSVNWYPKDPDSVLFEIRKLVLVDTTLNTVGTILVRVLDNYLDTTNRAGRLSFRLDDGTTISFPVTTYGPVSIGPLWTSSSQGLITG